MLSRQMIEGFQRLVAGDLSYRLPRNSSGDEEDTLALSFNAVADELERTIGEMRSSEQRLNHAVDAISAALLQVGEGNLDVHVERDYKGDQIDVLAFLVDTTIGELRLRVADDQRRSAEIQSQLEALVEDRTRDLRDARDTAEAATRAKSDFLAMMSHEIRTPLNAVIGMTSLLMDTALTPAQREFASTIRTSGDALLSIINDILDFSKIEAGRIELEQRPFGLHKCVENAMSLLVDSSIEKGLRLSYAMDPQVPAAIIGDEARLRQVLLNLLSNAIKFTESGEIKIAVTTSGPTQAPLRTIHFSVRDTGIGIPRDRMDRLFHAFSQLDSSTTRNYGGTGLGLIISKRLARLMGGDLWVESEGIKGKGSTFHFTIQAKETEALPQEFLQPAHLDLRGKRVLIVDDNASNLRTLSLQTEAWGMARRSTRSPMEALSWIKQGETFDIGLIDQQMPEMDGPHLGEEIRKLRDERTLPLVLISSTRAEGKQNELFSAQLLTPLHPSQLYDALIGIMAGHAVPTAGDEKDHTSIFDPDMARRLPLHILVAEDHATNQRLVLLMLERLGYRADVAANGLEVLAALERQTYDVILMDVQMPEMDGLETTRQIRGLWPGERGPRIVAMTASVTKDDRRACLNAGMNDYLPKPIRVEELIAALSKSSSLDRDGLRTSEAGRAVVAVARDVRTDATSSAALDPSALDSLRQLVGGDNANLRELIQSFLDETPPLLINLHNAVQTGDKELLRRAAHTLKSSCRDFGAIRLSELCQQLEALSKAGSFKGAAELVARAQAEYEPVQIALKNIDVGG